jgi:hypothetical protein
MRLAYLGYDKNAFKSTAYLAQYFQQIDTYLLNYDNQTNDSDICDLPIMAAHVYISKDQSLYTEQHKFVKRKISLEYNLFKKSISSIEVKELKADTEEPKGDKNYSKIIDIISLDYDRKSNQYKIVTKYQGNFEYDYLIIQDHHIISDLFKQKKQSVFKGDSDQFYAMLSLDFAIKAKLGNEVQEQEFIFVENTEIKSIFDNWYICKFSQQKISINFYIPYKQRHHEAYINFLVQRNRALFEKIFITFEMGEILNKSIIATNGFAQNHIAMINKQSSFVFPSFSYWSKERVAGFINEVFLNKNKKNKIFFSEKENS